MFDFRKNIGYPKFVSRRVAIITLPPPRKKNIAVDEKIGSSFDELVIKHFRGYVLLLLLAD